jgi:hypothetical protein
MRIPAQADPRRAHRAPAGLRPAEKPRLAAVLRVAPQCLARAASATGGAPAPLPREEQAGGFARPKASAGTPRAPVCSVTTSGPAWRRKEAACAIGWPSAAATARPSTLAPTAPLAPTPSWALARMACNAIRQKCFARAYLRLAQRGGYRACERHAGALAYPSISASARAQMIALRPSATRAISTAAAVGTT